MYKIFSIAGLIIVLIVSACSESPSDTDPKDDNSPDEPSPNNPPIAQISVTPESITVGDEVTLDGSESSDPDGDDIGYEWDLSVPSESDAELSDKQVENPTFIPDIEGDYLATLTIDDEEGEGDQEEITIPVGAPEGVMGIEIRVVNTDSVDMKVSYGYEEDGSEDAIGVFYCYEGNECDDMAYRTSDDVVSASSMEFSRTYFYSPRTFDRSFPEEGEAIGVKGSLMVVTGEGYIEVVRSLFYDFKDGFPEITNREVVFESDTTSEGEIIEFEWGDIDGFESD